MIELTLGDIFKRNARLYPARPALIWNGTTITHAEMLTRARRLGSALGCGLMRQDRVAILSQNSREYLEAMVGTYLAGLILVTLNWRLAPAELLEILKDCQPSVLLFESQFGDVVENIRAQDLGARMICIGDCPSWAESYDAIVSSGSEQGPTFQVFPDDIASLIYTSGTTGLPKGVMLSHRGLFSGAMTNRTIVNAATPDRALVTMPLYHVGATIVCLAYATAGAAIVLHKSFNAVNALRAIEVEKITHIHTAPTLIYQLLETISDQKFDTSSLTNILYSSSPMPEVLLRRGIDHFGPIFTQVYGLTECVGGTALYPYQHVLSGEQREVGRLASAGQPNIDTLVRIVAPDGTDCKTGEIGEIVLMNPSCTRGYWNNSVLTSEVLRDGWFHTGDLGYLDEENFLFIVDRKKDMIISGGENIYSREIEAALLMHPEIDQAAVIGVPDPRWGEAVKAFVVRRAGSTLDDNAVIAFCKSRIASYKKPRSVEFVGTLPQLPSGKIDKKALRAPYWPAGNQKI